MSIFAKQCLFGISWEQSLTSYLVLSINTGIIPAHLLSSEHTCFLGATLDQIDQSAAQTARAQNKPSMLLTDLAELEEDTSGMLDGGT